MKALLWVYETTANGERRPEFWENVDFEIDGSGFAISCEIEVEGSLPHEGESLNIGIVDDSPQSISAPIYVAEVDHPIFPINGVVVCKTYIHAFASPNSFERLKSAAGWTFAEL